MTMAVLQSHYTQSFLLLLILLFNFLIGVNPSFGKTWRRGCDDEDPRTKCGSFFRKFMSIKFKNFNFCTTTKIIMINGVSIAQAL